MEFTDYINIEEETINEFINQQPKIELNLLMNESFSVYDFTFVSAGTHNGLYTPILDGVCEAKTRNEASTSYPEGALLELTKLTGVCQEISKAKDEFLNLNKTIKGFYLVKYTDRTFLFDLDTLDLGQIEYRKLPKTTAKSRNMEWITKAIIIIPYEKAILTY